MLRFGLLAVMSMGRNHLDAVFSELLVNRCEIHPSYGVNTFAPDTDPDLGELFDGGSPPVWCAPWQLTIPANVLKASGNQLEVTVANLWVNRLVGDEFVTASERKDDISPFPQRFALAAFGITRPGEVEKTPPLTCQEVFSVPLTGS